MAARKKTGGKALVSVESRVGVSSKWKDKLKAKAARDRASATSVGGWSYVSTEGGSFTFNDDDLGNELRVVILAATQENLKYAGRYVPGEPTGVECYAIGELSTDPEFEAPPLAPPASLATKQNDQCEGCAWNAFGSADEGRGKACGNKVRIAMIPATEISELSTADCAKVFAKESGALLRIPPTSLKAWGSYVKLINDGLGTGLMGVATDIRITPDKRTQFKLEFDAVGIIESDDLLDALEGREKEAIEECTRPPQLSSEVDDAPTAGRSAGVQRRRAVRSSSRSSKKKTSKKKAKTSRAPARKPRTTAKY